MKDDYTIIQKKITELFAFCTKKKCLFSNEFHCMRMNSSALIQILQHDLY